MSANPVKKLPRSIDNAISQTRGLIRRYVFTETICWLVIVACATFWLFGCVDFFPVKLGVSESPRFARMVMLALFGGTLLYVFFRFGILRLLTKWSKSAVALVLERRFPIFQSTLISTVQGITGNKLTQDNDHSHSRPMLELTEQSAIERVAKVDVSTVIDWSPLKWKIGLAALGLVASVVLVFIFPEWTRLWAQRFFSLSDEKWPRQTEMQINSVELNVPLFTRQLTPQRYTQSFGNNTARVPIGGDAMLRVAANIATKRSPETCQLIYRKDDGTRGRVTMRRLSVEGDDWQPFVLDDVPFQAIDQSFDLTVVADDSRVSGYRIEAVESPLIAELNVEIERPDYLMNTSATGVQTDVAPYQLGMKIPQGSNLTLKGIANSELSAIEYSIIQDDSDDGSNEDDSSVESPNGDVFSRVDADGKEFEIGLGRLTQNQVVEFRVWDKNGICSQRIQQYVLSVSTDGPPELDLKLAGVGQSITAKARIPIELKIDDDNGVSFSEISLAGPDVQYRRELKPETGEQETVLDLVELRRAGSLTCEPGEELSIQSTATDYFDLNDDSHESTSAVISLDVVTPDELLILLEKREFNMRARLEHIISEMRQMRSLLDKIGGVTEADWGPGVENSAAVSQRNASYNPAGIFVAFFQDESDSNLAEKRQRVARLQNLRAQQSTTQAVKSRGELSGIEREIARIRDELQNNRMDNADRMSRLEGKIRKPLESILDNQYPQLMSALAVLEESIDGGSIVQPSGLAESIKRTDETLSAMEAVLADMIDIGDFNEIVDMVRGMIDDQQRLLDETKQEQKRQMLELFDQ